MPSSRPPADPARDVWRTMQGIVDVHGRKRALQEAIGFRLGGGGGKILFQLRDRPMTLSEIAEAHAIDAPYATVIVNRLEALGLVERTAHPDDRRRKLVRLTPAGKQHAATADRILNTPPPGLAALSKTELKALSGLLERIISAG